MKTHSLRAAAVALVTAFAMASNACAADFYFTGVTDGSKRVEGLLFDPGSIVTTSDGNKRARVADIEFDPDSWNDEVIEVDCSSARFRTVSSQLHMVDLGSVSNWIDNMPDGDRWINAQPNRLEGLMHKIICAWSPSQLDADHRITKADFEHAVAQAAGIMAGH